MKRERGEGREERGERKEGERERRRRGGGGVRYFPLCGILGFWGG